MSYKAVNEFFEVSAELESCDLPDGAFVAKNCKAFRIALGVASVFGTVGGFLLFFFLNEEIGLLLLAFGVCLLLVLPTILSYKCLVTKTLMREEYYVLFFQKRKEILWEDVQYKKIKAGNTKTIKLYDENKKRLISFDETVVGFNRILKLAKRSCIKDISSR